MTMTSRLGHCVPRKAVHHRQPYTNVGTANHTIPPTGELRAVKEKPITGVRWSSSLNQPQRTGEPSWATGPTRLPPLNHSTTRSSAFIHRSGLFITAQPRWSTIRTITTRSITLPLAQASIPSAQASSSLCQSWSSSVLYELPLPETPSLETENCLWSILVPVLVSSLKSIGRG